MTNNPWGKKPGGGNSGGGNHNPPPSSGGSGNGENPFERLMRDAQARMRGGSGFPSGENAPSPFVLAFAGLVMLWMASGIYRVNSDELGVVTRFGAYNRIATPGLNYHLPFPMEQVFIPSVTSINRVEVGFRGNASENPNIRIAKMAAPMADTAGAGNAIENREGLMLTGDRNIVDIDFEVQWKIDAAHPEKFLFNMRNPAENVKPVAQSAMREVIGRNTLDDILTGAQSQIAEETKTLMQQMFNEYDAGIEIVAVNLSRPDVPEEVIGEFQDVKRAEQDKQTAESVAEGYRNDILPRAKGDGAKMIEDAEAYKAQVVADATGNAARFKQIYAEYVQAKDVTRRRMYLETMEAVFKNMPKIIVDSARGGAMPVLPLTLPQAGAAPAKAN